MAVKSSKKKTGATRTSESKSFNWSWLFVGTLVAGFVFFLFYLDSLPTAQEQKPEPAVVAKKQVPNDTKKPTKPKHQFDFYTVLPDREVKVSRSEHQSAPAKSRSHSEPKTQLPVAAQQASHEQAKTSSQKIGAISLYQLQVGAFSALEKADTMKARLAFLGVESNIQVFQSNGQKMYRVRVGPSTDEHRINQIKAQLKAKHINTFVQKVSG